MTRNDIAEKLARWDAATCCAAYAKKNRNPTAGKRIYWPAWDCYVTMPLMAGNSKVKTLIFNLPPVSTCPNCKNCEGTCYAIKDYMYPKTRDKWAIHEWSARHDIPWLEAAIRQQLKTAKKSIVRIHGAGDFFSPEYVRMWCRIARRFPSKKFYYYTKAKFEELETLSRLPNVNQVESILPDGEINYGDDNFIDSMLAKYKDIVALCPNYNKADIDAKTGRPKKYHCVQDCSYCVTHQYVLIRKH